LYEINVCYQSCHQTPWLVGNVYSCPANNCQVTISVSLWLNANHGCLIKQLISQPTDTLPSVLPSDNAVAQSARVCAFFGCALCETLRSSSCQKYIKLQGPNVFRCYARFGCFGQMLDSITLIYTASGAGFMKHTYSYAVTNWHMFM